VEACSYRESEVQAFDWLNSPACGRFTTKQLEVFADDYAEAFDDGALREVCEACEGLLSSVSSPPPSGGVHVLSRAPYPRR
jgi:hypothetical protein